MIKLARTAKLFSAQPLAWFALSSLLALTGCAETARRAPSAVSVATHRPSPWQSEGCKDVPAPVEAPTCE